MDPSYLGSLRAFDAALMLDLGARTRGIVAVDAKYHERAKPETPRPENLARYLAVAKRSGIFRPGALEGVKGRTALCVMWLEHLLLLSMLQHPSKRWRWGRYVVVHPAGNSDIAGLCARYAGLLKSRATFSAMTLEELLGADALPKRTVTALRRRYLVT
jgi:hypothetical protein